jgi:anti-sigma factor RsiW
MTSNRPISEDDLHAYIDGALDALRRGEVEAYLVANPDIAERVRGFSQQRTMLRDHFAPVLDEPLPPELNLSRIAGDIRHTGWMSGWRAAAAACLLVAGGAAAGWLGREAVAPEATGVTALAHEAAANYAVYAPDRVRPVEIRAGEGGDLADWMGAHLGQPVAPPDLSGSGYRLMGGRVVATAHGPAGLFMYDDDHGSRVVLLTRRMAAADKEATMVPQQSGAVATWSWARNGLGYSLAGQRAPGTLHELANEVRRQGERGA